MKRVTALALAAALLCGAYIAFAEDEVNVAKVNFDTDKLQLATGIDRQKTIEDLITVGKPCLTIVNSILLEEDPKLAARIDALIKQLGADDPAKRTEAQQKLIATGYKALTQVTAATKDPDGEIAYRCMNIKVAIEENSAAEVAMRTRQFTALIEVVKALRDQSSLKALGKCAADSETDIRVAATDALASYQDPATLEALSLRLKDGDIHIRLLAGAGIMALKSDAARAKTVAMLLDRDENIYLRKQAALVLKATGEKKYAGDMIKVLGDPSFIVRYYAFEALQALSGNASETFGYRYDGDAAAATAARNKAIQQWKDWWKKNG